jgi:hypothetical protein
MNRHERRKADRNIREGIELSERMMKGLPPRNEQEAKDMDEAKALMSLFDAFAAAPEGADGDQIREDMVEAARARAFGTRN